LEGSRGQPHQARTRGPGGFLTIVIPDASALVEYLLRTESFRWIQTAISDVDHDLHVPALCDVEVTAALRRALLIGVLDERRAGEAVEDYLDLPLTRHGHQSLIIRMLGLRDNFSAYDATYVALAERLGGGFLTADRPLARSVGAHLGIALITE
jgi:predicted nucleic acid-binding protein